MRKKNDFLRLLFKNAKQPERHMDTRGDEEEQERSLRFSSIVQSTQGCIGAFVDRGEFRRQLGRASVAFERNGRESRKGRCKCSGGVSRTLASDEHFEEIQGEDDESHFLVCSALERKELVWTLQKSPIGDVQAFVQTMEVIFFYPFTLDLNIL